MNFWKVDAKRFENLDRMKRRIERWKQASLAIVIAPGLKLTTRVE